MITTPSTRLTFLKSCWLMTASILNKETNILPESPSLLSTDRPSFLLSTSESTSVVAPRDELLETSYVQAANNIRSEVKRVIQEDATYAGPILRLAFHDSVVRSVSSDPNVGGGDGSIRYELSWSENRGLSKPLKVVQDIYESQKHSTCDDSYSSTVVKAGDARCESKDIVTLSFADTLALCGAAAVESAKGPHIPIRLGRKDITRADNRLLTSTIEGETERSTLTTSLPSPALDSLGLRMYFQRLNFTDIEMVALMGAHDLGRHVTLLDMSKDCIKNLTRSCLENAPVTLPFVSKDPDTLSNLYYQTLLRWNDRDIQYGEALFIPTDVAMVVDDDLRKIIDAFAKDESLFFQVFKEAYQKLVDTTASSTGRY